MRVGLRSVVAQGIRVRLHVAFYDMVVATGVAANAHGLAETWARQIVAPKVPGIISQGNYSFKKFTVPVF
jgi:hypothetical protein